ncbi:NifQ family protein [Burkholderiales bacterium GJ-E10]|nr:NifQ family protein [Burkholderiales bacterium GJ-E10]
MPGPVFSELLRSSRFPDDRRTIAFAGAIARALEAKRVPVVRGLSEERFQRLLRTCFPGVHLQNGTAGVPSGIDEFDDLLALLREHAATRDEANDWLAHCIASAAMGEMHLWQDMGLPGRALLSDLFFNYFPTLAAGNTGDMKWKKYLYRELCERAGIRVCRSPRCDDCPDRARCFGPEEAVADAA